MASPRHALWPDIARDSGSRKKNNLRQFKNRPKIRSVFLILFNPCGTAILRAIFIQG